MGLGVNGLGCHGPQGLLSLGHWGQETSFTGLSGYDNAKEYVTSATTIVGCFYCSSPDDKDLLSHGPWRGLKPSHCADRGWHRAVLWLGHHV